METILSKESLAWFDQSRREMQMFKTFFDARTKMEHKMEMQWASFSTKWQKKFEDVFKDPSTSKHNMSDIVKLLADEAIDNANICCSVKSLLERKRRSPAAILKRWLVDPVGNTTCLEIEQFKKTFNSTTSDLTNSEHTVENAKKVLQERTEAYKNPKDYGSIKKKSKSKQDPEELLHVAADSYRNAVKEHQKIEQQFVKEMTSLQECLESYENNRLSTLLNSLEFYHQAVGQYEQRRETRLQHLQDMKECFNSFSIEQTVTERLDSLQKQFHSRDYLNDPFPLDTNTGVIEVKHGVTGVKHGVIDVKQTSDVKAVDWDPEFNDNEDDSGNEIDSVPALTKQETKHGGFLATVDSDQDKSAQVDISGHKVVALESYTSLLPDHLSFHTGQKIMQKQPANSDGLAYGYVVTNKYLRQRDYGFFPERIVAIKLESKKRRMKNFFRKR